MTHAYKYARIEEERRFLLRGLPQGLNDPEPKQIIDHYWPDTRLRLRRIETLGGETLQLKLTQKYYPPQSPPEQTLITNIYLTDEEYSRLSSIGGSVLRKVRHRYLHQGSGYSLDVFEGELEGLFLAELHAGQGNLAAGSVPEFAVCEVTAAEAFTGGRLALTGKAQLSDLLDDWLVTPQ